MKTDGYSFLKVEFDDGVAVIRFNRPENGNRWARSDEWELAQVFSDVRSDDVKAIVLTGSGDTFCGGAHHSDDPFDAFDYYNRSIELFGSVLDLDTPLVVAINGTASGSGLTLAMFGDIVIAEEHVQFSDAHVKGGVVTATGSFLWPPSIGLLRAKRYLLTGDAFSAADAERWGLVTEVVPTGGSLDRALEFARRFAAMHTSGVRGTKRALNTWLKVAFGPVFQHALSLEFMSFPAELLNYGRGDGRPEQPDAAAAPR
ncbi:MAG TPA: enoyl-CoA hydratase/isomerase family protein [Acidimicrobiales bacterium]|nr:enoyl-CoA hydratase/isomerase family protein [Acidimicrobiales bacterium]